MKLGKIKPMEIGKTMVGAGAGALVGEMAADKIVEMVESDMAETGALILGAAVGAYLADSQKGMLSSAGIGFSGELTKAVLKKYVPGMNDQAPATTSTKTPVKGVEDEIGEIYDEISKALEVRGANDPIITGMNDPIIMGMSDED